MIDPAILIFALCACSFILGAEVSALRNRRRAVTGIVVADSNGRTYVSTTGGVSWTLVAPPLPDPALTPVSIRGNFPLIGYAHLRPSQRPLDRPAPDDVSHQDFNHG